ncbi:MAG: cytidylate kinase family protein [Spirochaetales bacterium]|nr:cytidylate kinase family protein [Spirochaetales bacterium]
MSVITLSRETGSLGDDVARLLAERLNYRLLNREALDQTIENIGFPDIPLERFDEHSPSFWENFTTGKDVYLDRLRTAFLDAALEGECVVLGRGGHYVLEGIPGVFRVRLIAGRDTRTRRLASILECDPKTAERYCRRSDHDRNGFSRFFFGGHWSDPADYDMTLCTDRMDAHHAAEVIRAAYSSAPTQDSQNRELLHSRRKAQAIRNQILYVQRIPVDLLEVEVDHTQATIRGTVTVRENTERCERAAREVNGIETVKTEVYYVNPVMTY